LVRKASALVQKAAVTPVRYVSPLDPEEHLKALRNWAIKVVEDRSGTWPAPGLDDTRLS
jgi:hypothetical protein